MTTAVPGTTPQAITWHQAQPQDITVERYQTLSSASSSDKK